MGISGLGWDDTAPFAPEKTLAQALLTPTKIYIKSMLPLICAGKIKGLAHITGGGLTENTPRMLPDRLVPVIDMNAWNRPALFNWLQKTGNVAESEMQRAFNCGIGLALAVAPGDVDHVISSLQDSGETAMVIGELKDA